MDNNQLLDLDFIQWDWLAAHIEAWHVYCIVFNKRSVAILALQAAVGGEAEEQWSAVSESSHQRGQSGSHSTERTSSCRVLSQLAHLKKTIDHINDSTDVIV
ncbi:uncharacterized protein V6R79_008441 [Siganus canaliculatus]